MYSRQCQSFWYESQLYPPTSTQSYLLIITVGFVSESCCYMAYRFTEYALAWSILRICNRVSFVMTGWSFIRSHWSDAGVIPRGLKAPKGFEKPVSCKVCCAWKPPRAYHSKLLNRCVFRMDHVCRWTGNVVGYGNQKFFILVLFYSSLTCIISALISLFSIFEIRSFNSPLEIFRLVFLPLCCISFLVIKSFLSEQIEYLDSNITLLETFKNCQPINDESEVFRQIFGNNPILWFLPIHSSLPPDFTEQVRGSTELSKPDMTELGVEQTEVEEILSEMLSNKKID
jgi:hypothetical protein